MIIAIDAMGGDNAPKATVEGALQAAKDWPDLRIVLVGDREKIEPLLVNKPINIEIRHASEVIGPDEEPVKAVRRKRDSSLVAAVTMVKNKEVDAVISAGNTGAFMTAGLLITGRMKGIERPALSPILPTIDRAGVLVLDAGANMDARPLHLKQYALMGNIYAEKVMGVSRPRVGLLNVGTEPRKGNELSKEAFNLLESCPINFVGNVEARDILNHVCDVVVCDGFSGNILLKSLEGMAGTLFSVMKKEFMQNMAGKMGALLLKSSFKRIKLQMDYAEYGGALLMGIRGTCIKAHGSSNARAIRNAVLQAKKFIENDVNTLIAREIQEESGEVHV